MAQIALLMDLCGCADLVGYPKITLSQQCDAITFAEARHMTLPSY